MINLWDGQWIVGFNHEQLTMEHGDWRMNGDSVITLGKNSVWTMKNRDSTEVCPVTIREEPSVSRFGHNNGGYLLYISCHQILDWSIFIISLKHSQNSRRSWKPGHVSSKSSNYHPGNTLSASFFGGSYQFLHSSSPNFGPYYPIPYFLVVKTPLGLGRKKTQALWRVFALLPAAAAWGRCQAELETCGALAAFPGKLNHWTMGNMGDS